MADPAERRSCEGCLHHDTTDGSYCRAFCREWITEPGDDRLPTEMAVGCWAAPEEEESNGTS